MRATTNTLPRSLGLSALVAGVAVFVSDLDLDLMGYGLIGLAILSLFGNVAITGCLRRPRIAIGLRLSSLKDAELRRL